MKDDNYCVRFLLTNARLLAPKMESLADAFGSLQAQIGMVTETWFKGGRKLEEGLADFEGTTGIRVLHRSRDGRTKSRGGGVAIAFDSRSCNLKKRTLAAELKKFEVVCAVGIVKKIV